MLGALAGVAGPRRDGDRCGGSARRRGAGRRRAAALAALLRRDGPGDPARPAGTAHPRDSLLRALAAAIAQACGARWASCPRARNTAGPGAGGAVPHRQAGGAPRSRHGAGAMLVGAPPAAAAARHRARARLADPAAGACRRCAAAATVVALSAFRAAALEDCADIMLPIAAFAETSGYLRQRRGALAELRGGRARRPARRGRRGRCCGCSAISRPAGFDYDSAPVDPRGAARCTQQQPDTDLGLRRPTAAGSQRVRERRRPADAVDPLVRRAGPAGDSRRGRPALPPWHPDCRRVRRRRRRAAWRSGRAARAGEFAARVDPRVAEPCVRLPRRGAAGPSGWARPS